MTISRIEIKSHNPNEKLNFLIECCSFSEKELMSECQRLFPLNQKKGNYWSVMREYVKRFKLLEGLDNLCQKNIDILQIRSFLKSTFSIWADETIGKDGVPKYYHKILNVHVSNYFDTLRSVSDTGDGFYRFEFDLNELKDQLTVSGKPLCYLKKAFCAGFLNSYRITKHWEGTLFKFPEREMGGEKYHQSADVFVFMLRSGISRFRSIMEHAIVLKLRQLHLTMLASNFKDSSNHRIKEIWSKYYLSPQDIIKGGIFEGTEKQKIFTVCKIHFHLLDAKTLINSLVKEFNHLKTKYPSFIERFRTVFCNSNMFRHIQRLKPLTIKTINQQPKRYISQNTLKELREPILWMGNQLKFASPTNESIKNGAIRYFLDIVFNSPEGREILREADMIDSTDVTKLIPDWSTGVGTSTIQQASGLLDAVVRMKRKKNRSFVKFCIEIIGRDKTTQGPLTSLKNVKGLNHSIIGDFLRIACNTAGGIPGIVVMVSNDPNGDLIYTIFKYDTTTIENLQKYGATFAIDLNRKNVKKRLHGGEDVKKMLKETYGETKIVLSKKLLKILPKYNTLGYMFKFYFGIITKITTG